MGWLSSRKKHLAEAEQLLQQAEEEQRKAQEEARQAARFRKSLRSGRSTDPGADAYMVREHEANRRIAERNASTLRKFARSERSRWF